MSYDERLAARVRALLSGRRDVVEKRMFGGLCFMVNGAMCCGLTKTDFMVRVGPRDYENALAQPHARPMDFTGRPLKGMVYVSAQGLRNASVLAKWVERGLRFVLSLPAETAPSTRAESRVAELMREFRAEPRMAAVIEALSDGSTKVGRHGLTVNGKLFARLVEGTLVVRLPEDRIAALVAARIGTRCDASRLRHWLKVTSPKASWIDLASQAHAFARRR
jgi:TfoX/Sxy family transcriptional regulator of competence genes